MGFIPTDVISQVLDRVDIVDVISSYIPLKQAGRNFKAPCPFHHEKTPSFVVNPEKQIFHCFGCGVGGNAISFVMQKDHMEFPDAVRVLAQKTGVEIPVDSRSDGQAGKLRQQLYKVNETAAAFFHNNLLSDRSPAANAAREYLKNRDVSLDIVKKFSLGFAFDQWDSLILHLKKQGLSPDLMEKAGLILKKNQGDGFYDRFRNRIIFPIFDVRNRCIAFGARSMESDNSAKYINSPETSIYTKGNNLYGFNWAKEDVGCDKSVIIVEGYMDFIMPFQSGVRNIVASLGTALTVEQIRAIRRYAENIIMLFDSDQAGESAMVRSLDLLIEEDLQVRVATLDKGSDPDSFIRKHGVEKFKERVGAAQSLFEFKLSSLLSKYGDDTIENRTKVAEEMLSIINKFGSAIIKTEYVKRLSEVLNISQQALMQELEKNRQSNGRSISRRQEIVGSEKLKKQDQIHPVEREILKLMLDEKKFVVLTKETVDIADFHSDFVREIVAKIYELSDQGKETSLSALISSFDDQRFIKLISGLMASENSLIGDKRRIHQDCIKRLKKDSVKNKKKKIRGQMEIANREGNQLRLEELAKEFNQLIKG